MVSIQEKGPSAKPLAVPLAPTFCIVPANGK